MADINLEGNIYLSGSSSCSYNDPFSSAAQKRDGYS